MAVKFVVDKLCRYVYRPVAEILLLTDFSSKKIIFLCSYLRSGIKLSNDCL